MSFFASTAAAVATVALAAANLGPPRVLAWPPEPRHDASVVEGAGFELAEPPDALAVMQAEVRAGVRAELQGVARSLEQTKAHYLAQDFEAMDRALAVVEDLSLDVLATPSACDALWEVEFRRGLAALGQGDPEAARARFGLAATLRATRRPDAAYYGPDVVQAFADAVESERAAVELPLLVAVEPSDATTVIDCVPVQTDRVALSSGLHVVWTAAPGHRPHAEVVDVSVRPVVRVTLEPEPDPPSRALSRVPEPVPLRASSPSARDLLWRLAEEVEADALVWLQPEADGWQAQLQVSGARGKLHRADTRADAVGAALAELGPDGRLRMVAPVVAPGPEPSPAPDRPKRRTWWIWTIAGGVVLTALAVGLGVGLGRSSMSGPSRQRIVVE